MDRDGIAKALAIHFVSGLQTPNDFERANDYVAAAVQEFPLRLSGAVAVNPLFPEHALREIDRCYNLGFRAVKLHPMVHGYYQVDNGAVDEVARLAGDLSLPVVIHSDWCTNICSPQQIVRLASRFPQTNFVLLHFGLYPPARSDVPRIAKDVGNVILDTSQTPDFPVDIYVHPVRLLGASRVMFGSDGPECSVALNLKKIEIAIENYGLTAEDATQVLSGNAHRLFGQDG